MCVCVCVCVPHLLDVHQLVYEQDGGLCVCVCVCVRATPS